MPEEQVTAPPEHALVAAPAPVPPPDRVSRISFEQLVRMAPSERRDAWINSLVEVEVDRQHYAYDKSMARDFAASGQFADIKALSESQAIATAMVKIQTGRAWGFNAADSMRYIYFTNGKPNVENEIVASKLAQAGFRWNTEFEDEEIREPGKRPWRKCVGCTLWLEKWNRQTQRYEPLLDRKGQQISVTFDQGDADHAEIHEKGNKIKLSEKWNFQSWARDMYYWRCIGRVKKFYAPDVLRGAVTREEALDVVPSESSPDMLPRELQPGGIPGTEPAEDSVRKTLRDKVLEQVAELNFPKAPETTGEAPAPEKP